MEPDDLSGMKIEDVKEYIVRHLITFKLTGKKIDALNEELERWNLREELARSKGEADLAAQAGRKISRVLAERDALTAENDELKKQIDSMRRQLPGLTARERSIDPDLLEQELLIAAGYNPGDEKKAGLDRKFADLERDLSADAALEALKKKIQSEDKNGEKT